MIIRNPIDPWTSMHDIGNMSNKIDNTEIPKGVEFSYYWGNPHVLYPKVSQITQSKLKCAKASHPAFSCLLPGLDLCINRLILLGLRDEQHRFWMLSALSFQLYKFIV